MSDGFGFHVEVAHSSGSRAGVLTTPHGQVQTPLFMPVATLASVKGVDIARVVETGATMLLANTYHLHLSVHLSPSRFPFFLSVSLSFPL